MNKKIIVKPGLGYTDTIFTSFCLKTLNFWKCLNVTPNQLTCFGFYASIISLYNLYYKNIKIAILFLVIRAYFDFIDGLYARKYDQVTVFGDYFDHISDIIYCIGVFVILFLKMKDKRYIYILLIFAGLFLAQFGCSEKKYRELIKDKSETSISLSRYLCFDSKYLDLFDNCMLYLAMIYVMIEFGNEK